MTYYHIYSNLHCGRNEGHHEGDVNKVLVVGELGRIHSNRFQVDRFTQ